MVINMVSKNLIKKIGFVLSALALICLSAFSISANDSIELSECLVTGIKNVNMQDSTAVTLPVTLKYGSTKLEENTDYTVSYKNNTSPGLATVTLEGIGRYSGILIFDFKILPGIILSEARVSEKGQIELEWEADEGYDGYRIYYTTDKKREFSPLALINNSKRTSYLFKKPVSGKNYYFKVCGYISDEEKTKFYGGYSGIVSVSVPVKAYSPVLWEGVYKSGDGYYLVITADDAGCIEIVQHHRFIDETNTTAETTSSFYFRKIIGNRLTDGYIFSDFINVNNDYKREYYIHDYVETYFYNASELYRIGNTIKFNGNQYEKTNIDPYEYFYNYSVYNPSNFTLYPYRNAFSKLKEPYWKNEEWKKEEWKKYPTAKASSN